MEDGLSAKERDELRAYVKGKKCNKSIAVILFSTALVATVLLLGLNPSSGGVSNLPTNLIASGTGQENDDDLRSGKYTLHSYDTLKPFASFLPGIAGKYGTPMWAFYVNRGQAIASFGLRNKDTPLMEFETANKAYQTVPFSGFRTFIKGQRGPETFFYEPFINRPMTQTDPPRKMAVSLREVELQETHQDYGVSTDVLYFALPDEDFPGLVRCTTISNLKDTDVSIELVDGLVKMQPFGVNDDALKKMGRTLEAFEAVYNVDVDPTLAFYHLQTGLGDSEDVVTYTEGNFVLSFLEIEETMKALGLVVDPAAVFGFDTTFAYPSEDFKLRTIEDLVSKQTTTSRTPSAMSASKFTLKAGQSAAVWSLYSHASSLDDVKNRIVPRVAAEGYFRGKRDFALGLVTELTSAVRTTSGSALFDGYILQNFMDNLLRGGYPVLLGDPNSPKVYHIFSRLHGDLERDYNYFIIEPQPYSQGPGNFRDVNQNRRSDVLWLPRIGDFNIRTFLSLVQADGFNPLTVQSSSFRIPFEKMDQVVASSVASNDAEALKSLLWGNLLPGTLLQRVTERNINLKVSKEEFLNIVAQAAQQNIEASYAQNGFWADHWTYILDQVESYLTVFPDKKAWLLFDSEPLPFYLSPATVAPRSKKYVVVNGSPRQTNTVYWDWEKQNSINSKGDSPDRLWQHQRQSWGVFRVSMASKLFFLAVIKFSSLDPWGMGVEMEAGKPGWLDALNGLPGMFGSGMPETFELLRTLRFLRGATDLGRDFGLHAELDGLLRRVQQALDKWDNDHDDFAYWDAVSAAREGYRDATHVTFDGALVWWSHWDIAGVLDRLIAKVQAGIDRAVAFNNGIAPTYFSWLPTAYDYTGPGDWQGHPYIAVRAFKPSALPLFLEGPTRQLKVVEQLEGRRAVYHNVQSSALFDPELQMYKICASMSGQPLQLGRIKAFGAGWLENESVWLHMSYKFYLELLKGELFEEFWHEAATGLVAFMDPKIYGRSPFEASSFLVSGAHQDKSMHGYGVAARLSGSTAEFISIWFTMMAGRTPFRVDQGGHVVLALRPALPAWLFDNQNRLSFRFLGSTLVTYHNPNRLDSWKTTITRQVVTFPEGNQLEIDNAIIEEPHSLTIRDGKARAIDVYLA